MMERVVVCQGSSAAGTSDASGPLSDPSIESVQIELWGFRTLVDRTESCTAYTRAFGRGIARQVCMIV